ncbi:S-layer homology domain-containing protein [Peptoniphilus sp. MSJ-1]|uniref:S-layer homology domain-containing protein n=1 Tax=Peptoniphilus ovalis TaxID=2841503 RepID=A0ABS6FJ39_9FIRM|nr:SHIRT domain-containing protein [Peptoniphilus ovalis]MBU5670190.1 S-layer homology domain-containing protein [Peptoniphilus ovalis]
MLGKRLIAFLMALAIAIGTVFTPSPTLANQSGTNSSTKEAKYETKIIEGKSYKAYKFSDLGIKNPEKFINSRFKARAAGDLIPKGDRYTVRVNWSSIDLSIPKHFPGLYFYIRTFDTGQDIAKSELITSEGDFKFYETEKYAELVGYENPDRYNWELYVPNEFAFDIRLDSLPGGDFNSEDIQVNITQRATAHWRAEWFTNTDRPKVKAEFQNRNEVPTEVVLNTKDYTDVQYDSVVSDTKGWYYLGKEIEIIQSGAQSPNDFNVQDPRTLESLHLKIKNPDTNTMDTTGKFVSGSTTYHYDVIGDHLTPYIATFRQELKVNFDTNGGTWKKEPKKDQPIGHSMALGDTWGDIEKVTIPDGANDLTPPTADEDKPANEFKGWSRTANGAVIDDISKEVITDDTTFYAIYGPEDQGIVGIKYVDQDNNDILDKYKVQDEEYPKTDSKKKDTVVDTEKITKPDFIGYKFTNATVNTTAGQDQAKYTENQTAEVTLKYQKLDSIVEGKTDGGEDAPDTADEGAKKNIEKYYVKVRFNKGENGKLYTGNTVPTEDSALHDSLLYYVNPRDEKTLSEVEAKETVNIKADEGYKVDENDKWSFNPDNINSMSQIVSSNTDSEGNEVKTEINLTAKYQEKTKLVKLNNPEKPAESNNYPKDPKNPTNNDSDYVVVNFVAGDNGKLMDGAGDNANELPKGVAYAVLKTAEYKDIKNDLAAPTPKADENYDVAKKPFGEDYPPAGTHKFTQDTTYTANFTEKGKKTVTVEFKAEDGSEVPQAVNAKKPGDIADQYVGSTVNAPTIEDTDKTVKITTGNNQGTWTFKEWDKNSLEVKENPTTNENKFVGTWKFEPTHKKTITVEFKAEDGSEVPQAVNAKKPGDIADQYVGSTVNAPTIEDTDKTVKITTGNNQGTWTFKAWDKDSLQVKENPTTNENKFIGTWTFKEAAKANVTYEFKYVGANNKELTTKPDAITADLATTGPQTHEEYVGSTINAPEIGKYFKDAKYEGKQTVTENGEQVEKEGTWTFSGWTLPDPATVQENPTGNQNKVIGTWTWTEKSKITVTYKFVSGTQGKDLPQAILDAQPAAETGYAENPGEPGYPVLAPNALVETDATTNEKLGTWSPGTWVKSVDQTTGNITYTLTWTFTEVGQSDQPTVDPVKPGDKDIKGKGKPGSDIKVELPDGTIVPGVVDDNGNWTVKVPEDKVLKENDVIKVTQKEKNKKPSDPVTVIVKKDSIPWTPLTPAKPIYDPNWDDYLINNDNKAEEHPVYAVVPKVDEIKTQPKETHNAYIEGYEDHTVRAEGNMTRAEAAAMVTRLAKLDLSDNNKPTFADIQDNAWYYTYINAAVKAGMLDADDNMIRPNDKITRAEFAKMIAAIDKDNDAVSNFEDIKGHRYEKEINKIYGNKRTNGMSETEFNPDGNLTRAEAAAFLNRMFDRVADADAITGFENKLVKFQDLDSGKWYYYDIVEASNSHELTRRGGSDKFERHFEKWEAVK